MQEEKQDPLWQTPTGSEFYVFEKDIDNSLFFENSNSTIMTACETNMQIMLEGHKILPTAFVDKERLELALDTLNIEDRILEGISKPKKWKVYVKN